MENKQRLCPMELRLQEQRAALQRPVIPAPSARSSLAVPSRAPVNRGPITPQQPAKLPPVPSFPSANSAQRAGSRKKVALDPGCSPLDWARLNSSGANLRGIQPSEFPVKVTKDILKQHKSRDDCWTMLGGKVYNITPYVKFHPGGVDEIMKCAGRDGTSLFNKYHAWVNYERMLEKCIVGFYVG